MPSIRSRRAPARCCWATFSARTGVSMGFVVSDCDAIDDFSQPHGHHYSADHAAGSAAGVLAGTDLDCGRAYEALVDAVHKNLLTEAQLDVSVKRLFIARMRMGMFDPPEQGAVLVDSLQRGQLGRTRRTGPARRPRIHGPAQERRPHPAAQARAGDHCGRRAAGGVAGRAGRELQRHSAPPDPSPRRHRN